MFDVSEFKIGEGENPWIPPASPFRTGRTSFRPSACRTRVGASRAPACRRSRFQNHACICAFQALDSKSASRYSHMHIQLCTLYGCSYSTAKMLRRCVTPTRDPANGKDLTPVDTIYKSVSKFITRVHSSHTTARRRPKLHTTQLHRSKLWVLEPFITSISGICGLFPHTNYHVTVD